MATQFRMINSGTQSDVAAPTGWNPVNGYPATGDSRRTALTGAIVCLTTTRPLENNNASPGLAGTKFYDSTLGKTLVHDGYYYRDPATGKAA